MLGVILVCRSLHCYNHGALQVCCLLKSCGHSKVSFPCTGQSGNQALEQVHIGDTNNTNAYFCHHQYELEIYDIIIIPKASWDCKQAD